MGLAAENKDTKTRILDEAETLLQEHGFSGFSYTHIAEKLGMKNAAVHYHFPAKADLGLAVIARFRERFQGYSEHLLGKYGEDPVRLLDGYIAIARSFLDKSQLGCPVAALEADFSALPAAMREETLRLSAQLRGYLTGVLHTGRERGVFRFDGPAEEKALMVAAALHGAMLMANAEDRQIFFTTAKQIKRDLGVAA